MLSSKNVATVAVVAIILALGTAGIATAIGQAAHAQDIVECALFAHTSNQVATPERRCLSHAPTANVIEYYLFWLHKGYNWRWVELIKFK